MQFYYSFKNDNTKVHYTHNIIDLWSKAEICIKEINCNSDPTPVNAIENIIKELDCISKSSEGYRYFKDKKNKLLIKENPVINLENLWQIVLKVNSFLDSVESQFYDNFALKK